MNLRVSYEPVQSVHFSALAWFFAPEAHLGQLRTFRRSPQPPTRQRPALTGLEMMQIMASGQCWAQAAVRVATMVALVLNRSSRVMPENEPVKMFTEHRRRNRGHFIEAAKEGVCVYASHFTSLVIGL